MAHPHGKPMGTGRRHATTGNKGRIAGKSDMASGMPCHMTHSTPRSGPANQVTKDGRLRKAKG